MKHLQQAFCVAVIKRVGFFHHTLSLLSTIFKRINAGGGRGERVGRVCLSVESQDW